MVQATRQPVIAGNWKMYKTTAEGEAFARALYERVSAIPRQSLPTIVLCPPFTAITAVKEEINELDAPFRIAAQTMDSHDQGAFTGEISPPMLLDLGVDGVVIGHSERRQYFNETDASVNEKTKAALHHGLQPIVCVGESLAEREGGQTDAVIQRQVRAALAGIDPDKYPLIVIAYEPVWAIGTGKVCESVEANRVCGLIRATLNETGSGETTRILYGGSVKADNAAELLGQPDIDGALVGGASLEADSFSKIIEPACLATKSS